MNNKETGMFSVKMQDAAQASQASFLRKLDPDIAMLENMFKWSFQNKNTVCQSQVLFYVLKRLWNLVAFIDKELVSCQISVKIILVEINSQSLILNYQRNFRNILLLAFLGSFWNFRTKFLEIKG